MSEPIFEWRPKLTIVPLRTTEPQSRVGMIFDKKKGILEWPIGPEGDQGPQGAPARPWRIVGYVTDAANLPTGLTSDDASKAWANTDTKAMHVWQGYRWHDPIPTGLSRPGDAGEPVNLTVGEVETLPSSSDATQAITGDAPNQVLSLGIPRGAPGDQGPMSPPTITKATDYVGLPPTRGQAITWSAAQEGRPAGWVATRPGGVLGQWSITEAEFLKTSLGGSFSATPSTNIRVVATVELSAMTVPYRLACEGVVILNQGARLDVDTPAHSAVTTFTVEVDYGGSPSGPMRVGYGRNDRHSSEPAVAVPSIDRAVIVGSYSSKLTPASVVDGVVPAGRTATVTVTMTRTSNVYWQGVSVSELGTDIQLKGIAV